MPRGGHKPKLPEDKKAKMVSFRLYADEVPYIKGIVKRLHEQKRKEQKMNKKWCVANNNGELAGHDLTEEKAKALANIMQEQEPDAEWEALEAD